jgi:HK97 family phage portal protein
MARDGAPTFTTEDLLMTEPLDWARVPVDSFASPGIRRNLKVWERQNVAQGRSVVARRDGADMVLEAFQDPSSAIQARAIDSFTDHPGLTEQIAAAFGYGARPWRVAGIKDAIGVPAIHRAVTLIANVGGGLSMEAWRRGVKLADDKRPRVIVRPDPFRTPRDFFRDTFYAMATRGEAWWWIAARDGDGQALSVINVPPAEVRVEEDPDDLRYPKVYWRDRLMPRADMRQITLMREPGELRGYGPLQVCGAAVSIAVESQEWAANFFAAGGYPNLWIKAAGDLSGNEDDPDDEDGATSEIKRLKNEWISTSPNTPKVTDESILDIKQFDPNPQGAQMLDARDFQNGDAARMYGLPGALLEYSAEGSSLTYQNLAEVMTNFLRTCLIPNYLEPVEQTMSDLLTYSTVAQFNVKDVNRADEKTRWDIYQTAVGVIGADDAAIFAREREGMAPGDVETAPVPLPAPAAIPASLPVEARTADVEVRCDGMRTRRRAGVSYIAKCDKLLSTTGAFIGSCPRCKKQHMAA